MQESQIHHQYALENRVHLYLRITGLQGHQQGYVQAWKDPTQLANRRGRTQHQYLLPHLAATEIESGQVLGTKSMNEPTYKKLSIMHTEH